MPVSTLAASASTNHRHPAIHSDDSMLLLFLWSYVWTVLDRAEKEVNAATAKREKTAPLSDCMANRPRPICSNIQTMHMPSPSLSLTLLLPTL